MITTKQLIKKYGVPSETGASYLVTINLPYPMRLAWDKKTKVNRISCHRLVANNFLNVFNELLSTYGYDKLVELGIDIYGGCFNFRKMRGGTDWSRHSWGVAIDLSPELNGLKTSWTKSQFSKPEYKQMIDIFYKHGFISLGKEKGYDAMHFEIKE